MKKVIILSKIPSPYRVPLFEKIHKSNRINLICVFFAYSQPNRLWKVDVGNHSFQEIVLESNQIFYKKLAWPIHFTRGVINLLRIEKPDVIITAGYESIGFWQAFIFAKIKKIRFILWSGATLEALHIKTGLVNFLRKFIIRNSDGIISYGTRASEMLITYGANPDKIFKAHNTVDTEMISNQVKQLLNINELINRRELNILYVGQLIERKGVEQVITALSEIDNEFLKFIIIGDGVQKCYLENLVNKLDLDNKISFVGYKQYDELIPFYANANALILPSFEEIWGLVVNEALAAGLPVISSIYAGVTCDLIDDSNGLIIDPYDIESIKNSIKKIVKLKNEFINKRFQIMEEINKKAGLDQYVETIINAINH